MWYNAVQNSGADCNCRLKGKPVKLRHEAVTVSGDRYRISHWHMCEAGKARYAERPASQETCPISSSWLSFPSRGV